MLNLHVRTIDAVTHAALILCRDGHKIVAIKLVRATYDCTLVEARVLVESMLAGSMRPA